jgi:hypothetical protein
VGDLVLIESPSPTQDLNTPPWEKPFPVILSIPTAVRVAGLDSWIHNSRVNGWNPSVIITPPSAEQESEPNSFLCEDLGGLKLLTSMSLLDPNLQYSSSVYSFSLYLLGIGLSATAPSNWTGTQKAALVCSLYLGTILILSYIFWVCSTPIWEELQPFME